MEEARRERTYLPPRGCRWLEGATAAGIADNLLTFAASLRRFLEAGADFFDALGRLPLPSPNITKESSRSASKDAERARN
jgi:hypothetical protein